MMCSSGSAGPSSRKWQTAETFAIDLRLVGGDTDRRWLLTFDGGKARLSGKDRFGHDVLVDAEAQAAQ